EVEKLLRQPACLKYRSDLVNLEFSEMVPFKVTHEVTDTEISSFVNFIIPRFAKQHFFSGSRTGFAMAERMEILHELAFRTGVIRHLDNHRLLTEVRENIFPCLPTYFVRHHMKRFETFTLELDLIMKFFGRKFQSSATFNVDKPYRRFGVELRE